MLCKYPVTYPVTPQQLSTCFARLFTVDYIYIYIYSSCAYSSCLVSFVNILTVTFFSEIKVEPVKWSKMTDRDFSEEDAMQFVLPGSVAPF